MSFEHNGYKLESDGTFGMINVKPIGRGSVPKELSGAYTSYQYAKRAVDNYVKGKEKDGKAKSSK